MRRVLLGPVVVCVAGFVSLLGCAADAIPPPPPPPIPPTVPDGKNPLVVAADPGPGFADPLLVPGTAGDPPARDAFTAEVVPGMERVDRLAFVEGGLCALVENKAPICLQDGTIRAVPTTEKLVRWVQSDGVDCRVDASRRATCTFGAGTAAKDNVADVVVAGPGLVYLLGVDRKVTSLQRDENGVHLSGELATDVLELRDLGAGAAAMRTAKGGIIFVDTRVGPARTVSGGPRASQLVPGFFRGDDDSLYAFGPESQKSGADPAVALRLGSGITDVAVVGAPAREVCVMGAGATLRCRPTARGVTEERRPADVRLSRQVKRFAPAAAPCVALANGTVACWGRDLARLQDLGLLVLQAFPGAIQPR